MPEPARCTCGQPRGSWECCRDGIDYLNGVLDDDDMDEMIAEQERTECWRCKDWQRLDLSSRCPSCDQMYIKARGAPDA